MQPLQAICIKTMKSLPTQTFEQYGESILIELIQTDNVTTVISVTGSIENKYSIENNLIH